MKGLIFWSGPGGALLCSAAIGGVQQLDSASSQYYGGKYFVGETISKSMAARIAKLFGGEYKEEPPQ